MQFPYTFYLLCMHGGEMKRNENIYKETDFMIDDETTFNPLDSQK